MIMIYLSRPREWTVAGVTSGTSLVQLRPSDQVGYQPINRLLNMRPVLRSRSVFLPTPGAGFFTGSDSDSAFN